MEELTWVIDFVNRIPTLAIWVLAGIFFYKVTIVGSIYGVIRFIGGRLFDYLSIRKDYKEIRPLVDGICWGDTTTDEVMHQLTKVMHHCGRSLLYGTGAEWLKDAIDEKIKRDKENK